MSESNGRNGFLDGEGAPENGPEVFIQWKGTDACFDFHCECGAHGHFDGYFAYAVRCGRCGKEWEMPCHLYPRPNDGNHDAKDLDMTGEN